MRIGRSGTRYGVALAAVLILLPVAYVIFGVGPVASALYLLAYCLAAAASIIYVMIVRRSDVLVIDDDGLLVSTSKGDKLYRWDDLLEVGWSTPSWPYYGGGLVIRPEGGTWDIPGPNAPQQVATLAIFGRRARNRARGAVRDACVSHGVPFAEKWTKMGSQPRPGSRLRKEG